MLSQSRLHPMVLAILGLGIVLVLSAAAVLVIVIDLRIMLAHSFAVAFSASSWKTNWTK
jgi:hypothetical protein